MIRHSTLLTVFYSTNLETLTFKKQKSQNHPPKYKLLPRDYKSYSNKAQTEDHPTTVCWL